MNLKACLLCSFVAAAASSESAAEEWTPFSFFQKHCVRCHGADEQNAQIQLDARQFSPQVWAKVYQEISHQNMPPADELQPSDLERSRLLNWIREETSTVSAIPQQRRLNRRELSASLRDLTGVPIDFCSTLPADAKIAGFDTGTAALNDGADSTLQWLEITRRAVESIRFLEPSAKAILKIDFREHEFNDFRSFLQKQLKLKDITTKSKRLISRKGVGLYLQTQWSGDRGSSLLALPAPATKRAALKVSMRLKANRSFPGIPLPTLWVKIGGKYVDYVSIGEAPQTLEYAVRMEDQLIEDGTLKIMLRSMVEMPYSVDGFPNDDRSKPEDNIPGGIGMYRPKFDRKKLRTPEVQPVPSLVVEWMEVDYNYSAAWPSENLQGQKQELEDSDESARELLKQWMDRAWRRPTRPEERQRFFELYADLRDQGQTFDAALRAAFQSVLLSGPFRFLAPPNEEDKTRSQFAIASRLSFMLTGAPPDSELRSLAKANSLRDATVLNEQVDRLLASPHSDQFVQPFVTQWLSLEQPITQTMSHFKKQDFRFGRHLKSSMKRETVEYVARMVQDNRPAKELVDSDWTMMNDVLAWHYRCEPIEGGQFRRVRLSQNDDDHRGGGVLGHAGIQSMLCWMGDNWSIYRGAWFLDRILDDPLPPPPLEVPELLPADKTNQGKTVRELLQQHQQDPNCAVCHRKMDPLGFAFQNFDLSGRWRNVEFDRYHRYELDGRIEWRGEGKSRPVDATGSLPRGETFTSYAEFKQLLVDNYIEDIVRGLLKKLVLYGTGRQATVADLVVIEDIMREYSTAEYPMKDMLKALIRSQIFLGTEQAR